MTLRLKSAGPTYNQVDEQKLRADLVAEDRQNLKRGQDIEMAKNGVLRLNTGSVVEIADGALVLTDTVTGDRRAVRLTSGALVVGPIL